MIWFADLHHYARKKDELKLDGKERWPNGIGPNLKHSSSTSDIFCRNAS